VLAGRVVAVDGEIVRFDDSAAGDAFAARVRAMLDEGIRRAGLDAPPAEPDDADGSVALDPPISLDLGRVGSVVWCTGSAAPSAGSIPRCSTPTRRPGIPTAPHPSRGCTTSGCAGSPTASATLPGMPKDAALAADAVLAHLALRCGM